MSGWCEIHYLVTVCPAVIYLVRVLTGAAEGEGDEMQKLEERARKLAEEAVLDQPKQDKNILFVRWEAKSIKTTKNNEEIY